MPVNVEVPVLGESVRVAVLVKWHKGDGETVRSDEPLAELETDKANVDLPSPATGVLRRAKDEGDTVSIGEIIARIDDVGAASATAAPSGAPSAPASPTPPPRAASGPQDLRPSARRVAAERGVDPSTLRGTGPGGMITREDASRSAAKPSAPGGERDADAVEADRPAATSDLMAEDSAAGPPAVPAAPQHVATAAGVESADGTKRVPMSRLRKRVAENLLAAQQSAALLTTFNQVDMQAITDLRARHREQFEKVHGVGLGLMSFFARACVVGLREFPRINARIDGDDVVYHSYVHLGIAVSTDRGLAVPVLRNVERMSFAQVEAEIKRVATAVREGKLGLSELSGGTFTITNGGIFGSLLSTPIVNPPQSAILGMHAIEKRPVVVNDQIVIRPMMYVALTYDHRLIDGRESVSFLVRLKQLLEDPARLLLEV